MTLRRFLHPPRTGGRSIVASWKLKPPEYRGHNGPTPGDGWRYGFVRNPWDRAVSLFHLLYRGRPDVTFPGWVAAGMPDADRTLPDVLRAPMTAWLGEADWVGRFEIRGLDLEDLAARLDRPVPELHRNRSEHRERLDHVSYYEDRADVIGTVAERYREDVERFGYQFRTRVLLHSVPGSGTRFFHDMIAPCVDEALIIHATADNASQKVARLVAKGFKLVLPVRDPVLTLVTNANGRSQQASKVCGRHFQAIREWAADPRALIVQCDRGDRTETVARLSRHIGVTVRAPTPWEPLRKHHTPDRTGLRASYLAGRIPAELSRMASQLTPVRDFYARLGYDVSAVLEDVA